MIPAGTNVTLSIVVVLGARVSYQWSSNNVAVDGATNAAFTLTNVSLSDSATYAVLVSNSYGSVLSSMAVWAVLPAAYFVPPTFEFQIDSNAVPGGFEPGYSGAGREQQRLCDRPFEGPRGKIHRRRRVSDPMGSYGSGNGQFGNPQGIAVDTSNNVDVVDLWYARMEKFDSNGNYLTQWGSQGSGNGQFFQPVCIALDASNNAYVTDSLNNRVEKFDDNGNYLAQWGSYGSSNGQFYYPEGVAVDRGNNVYVVDQANARVEKFDSNGNYLAQWGSRGSGTGQFQNPSGVAVDSSNNVYVVDGNISRVEKFDGNGNYLTQWGGWERNNSGLAGVAAGQQREFYLCG